MEKPISIIMSETKSALITACNNSKLHIGILELILKDLYEEVHKASLEQLKQDQIVYQQLLISEKENKEEIRESNE